MFERDDKIQAPQGKIHCKIRGRTFYLQLKEKPVAHIQIQTEDKVVCDTV